MPLWMLFLLLSSEPADTPADASFAFADRSGEHLLGLDDMPHPEKATKAVCGGAHRLLEVKFVKRQHGAGARATSAGFDRHPGNLFRIVEGKARDGESCLVAPPAFFESRRLVPISRGQDVRRERHDACDAAARKAIEAEKARPLAGCWPIASLGEEGEAFVVEFERRDQDALAALVVRRGGRLVFDDYPAKFEEGSPSLWRVDDEGVVHPEAFEMIFALEGEKGLEIGLEWHGAEGSSLKLLQARGKSFLTVLEGYRYTAPL